MENKILATVNGTNITERDMEIAMTRFPKENQAYFASEQGQEQLLEQLISFELLYKHANDLNLQESEDFKSQLEIMKKDLLIQSVVKNVLDKITVSEEAAREFYDNNTEMFNTGESVSAKHILIESEEKANEIKEKIEQGLSFEDAAKEFSTCPSSSQGGNLGNFTRGRMVPEFENAAFELNIGEVSSPVKTQFGYHIIKVEEKLEPTIKSFEEVKDSIIGNLTNQNQNDAYIKLINELKEKYKVEINK